MKHPSSQSRPIKNRGQVDLVIPVKSLSIAKSRLRGTAGGRSHAHEELVLTMVNATVTAAIRSHAVAAVVVVTPDPIIASSVESLGARAVTDEPSGGVNAAIMHGVCAARDDGGGPITGALLADLPALRHHELTSFIAAAAGRRAFCADRHGSGTTLLLSACGEELRPSFGAGSALAHRESGAVSLTGEWPSLRADVDTVHDLCVVAGLGWPRPDESMDPHQMRFAGTSVHTTG
ncbi:2-phospho-L-lactate guanylyltransferase [Rhodococcus opacus]|uniref:2-phospho-L-lactate guanylyltransferase n=1 Tax=Rhodococcus opacus TaxID=37919 RepID=A0AAX3Y9M9_RHOOP|nr:MULTISPECIES: 2-phospho-L-lactate guanylyltransferase [Rhodococcus]NHU41777.1 2-phospho-L-lactate guanylyltransferase [Rhodococcus sp. A14]MCZ4586331.1 2-phospho-L-lactate guanylyltransferase [Rhodococcus opacus]MDI9940489.1 2-phospho-L-lactate guanylyltransferase [Rhodococcus sp. IEGM 1351]UZG53008.1 2-phospho-L-lactate guanylyltransferase [Rhodococcus opacus]WKN53325.1 2-phospho-L-lactate guanylyltransferase [Rhodococcus opacus]